MLKRVSLLALCLLSIAFPVSAKTVGDVDVEAPSSSSKLNDVSSSTPSSTSSFHSVDKDALLYKVFDEKVQAAEKLEYQAQVSQLINHIMNAFYSNNKVFVRELLSNASDAINKLRVQAKGNAELTQEITENARIQVRVNKQEGTITFLDSGIGMTHDELRDYLGTIAKSGTSELMKRLKESKKDTEGTNEELTDMIGQFGVGFYSAFLVADRVYVVTTSLKDKDQNKEQEQWVFIADSNDSSYRIIKDPRGVTFPHGHGTEITLRIKKGESEQFLDTNVLKEIMQTYANFHPYPIYLVVEKEIEREIIEEPVEEEKAPTEPEKKEESEESKEESKITVEDEEPKEKNEEPKKRVEKVTVQEEVRVNDQKPLWLLKPHEVTQEQYDKLFMGMFNDHQKPLATIHFAVEGDVNFKGILFIPRTAPFNLYSMGKKGEADPDIRLFVRRSFVTNKIEDVVPPTLAFVRGVIDSDDLPLNISREQLQISYAYKTIKAKVGTKIAEMLKSLAEDESRQADFDHFQSQYGPLVKYEIVTRENLRSKLAALLRYETNVTYKESQANKIAKRTISLNEYVKRKQADQKQILYLTGSKRAEILNSPFMDRLNSTNLEVLFALDPMDENVFKALNKYEEMTFQNCAQDGFKLPESTEQEARRKTQEVEFKPLVDYLSNQLKSRVEKVVLVSDLAKYPMAVVANQWGWTGHTEKLMLSQQRATSAQDDPLMSFFQNQKKILHVNPEHQTIKLLLKAVQKQGANKAAADTDKSEVSVSILPEVIKAMYDSALLSSGFVLHHPKQLAEAVDRLAFQALGETFDEEEAKKTKLEEAEEAEDPFAKMMAGQTGHGDGHHDHDHGEHEHHDHEDLSEGEVESEAEETGTEAESEKATEEGKETEKLKVEEKEVEEPVVAENIPKEEL